MSDNINNNYSTDNSVSNINERSQSISHSYLNKFYKFDNLLLYLDERERNKLMTLQDIFIEKLNTMEILEKEVLHILINQLLVITKLAKEKYINEKVYEGEKFDLIKQYNILVDKYYKQEHKVKYYASLLNKSPKTLCNLFAQYNYKKPSLIIHDRIINEAKRLFYYTNKSDKEIAYELGFNDAAHFSRFFKNATNQCPSNFRIANNSFDSNPLI